MFPFRSQDDEGECFTIKVDHKNLSDRGHSCRACIESFPKNIDDVQPLICLTIDN